MTYDVNIHLVRRVEADSAEDAVFALKSALVVMDALGLELRAIEPVETT